MLYIRCWSIEVFPIVEFLLILLSTKISLQISPGFPVSQDALHYKILEMTFLTCVCYSQEADRNIYEHFMFYKLHYKKMCMVYIFISTQWSNYSFSSVKSHTLVKKDFVEKYFTCQSQLMILKVRLALFISQYFFHVLTFY